jgi:6-phosphogluconate dehydrogenase
MAKANLGLIGLAVMGQNLVLNMERHGYTVAVHNRTVDVMESFTAAHPGKKLVGCTTVEEMVRALDRPRRIMLMVKAGSPVDGVIKQLSPLLAPGDLIIDGGNSHFSDTERRASELERQGLRFIGAGVSGGEEGALLGPSIMPGGDPEAYALVSDVFEAIAARANGEPCVTYLGPRGAGHYVKMVHNGIEYGDMQLIAEAYDILHRGLGLTASDLHNVFADWNRGELESYLVEITADIFTRVDELTGLPLIDLILDEAQQKGTGKWTSQNALDLGVPIPTINAAVEARLLSAYRSERLRASRVLRGPGGAFVGSGPQLIEDVRAALYMAKICSYAQGMALLQEAGREYDYNLRLWDVASIWRGGCIIRARFLDKLADAFRRDPDLPNLLLDESFAVEVQRRQTALRSALHACVELGIPCPALSSALAYYDAYRAERLPANLTQAQRDYFGAHTYHRVDRDGVFHTKWA